jgi:AAA ATPase domain
VALLEGKKGKKGDDVREAHGEGAAARRAMIVALEDKSPGGSVFGARRRFRLGRSRRSCSRVVDVGSVGAVSDLVGRRQELAALEEFLDRMQREPAVLLVEGASGIGKTVIWRAGVELARARNTQVLSCRPGSSEVNLSFAGLGDLSDGPLDDALPRLPDPQRRALESALALSNLQSPADRRVLGLAFLAILRWQVRRAPVLLAVDDVQWLDAPSARILEFALR